MSNKGGAIIATRLTAFQAASVKIIIDKIGVIS